MPCQLAQQRMTLSDLEWPFHASRAISEVAELLVYYTSATVEKRRRRHTAFGFVRL